MVRLRLRLRLRARIRIRVRVRYFRHPRALLNVMTEYVRDMGRVIVSVKFRVSVRVRVIDNVRVKVRGSEQCNNVRVLTPALLVRVRLVNRLLLYGTTVYNVVVFVRL